MRFITQVFLAGLVSLAFGSPLTTRAETPNQVDTVHGNVDSPADLFARQGSIFNLCFGPPRTLVLQHQRNMDDVWSLQAIARGAPSTWTGMAGSAVDLNFQAWTTRDAGVARAHFRLRVNPLARFPQDMGVAWGLHRRRGTAEECIRSETITFVDDEASFDFTLDSSTSYCFTWQNTYG